MSREHIKYVVPAISFLLLVGILPPILLIVYPLGFKVLGWCKLSELKIVTRIANTIPLQVFDSLQSCFKDKFRFFSGLYFFYRVIPLCIYSLSPKLSDFYIYTEIFLILVLSIHSLVHPYKQYWHNVTDSLLFTNLAIINTISLFNHQQTNEAKDNTSLTVSTLIQTVLIYLPLIYITLITLCTVFERIKRKVKERRVSRMNYGQETLLDSIYLPALRLESSEEVSYKKHT